MSKRSQRFNTRIDFNQKSTLVVLQNRKGAVDLALHKCSEAVLCKIASQDPTQGKEIQIDRYKLKALDG